MFCFLDNNGPYNFTALILVGKNAKKLYFDILKIKLIYLEQ